MLSCSYSAVLWKQLSKAGHPSCQGAVHLPYEEWQDSDLQFNSRFFLKAGEGDGGKTKKNEAKNRLRCILMVWTKLSTKHNFTNCEGFQKSFLAKWLSWVLHLSLLTAEKVPNGDDMTDGFYPLHLLSWDKRASSWQSCLPRFRQII